MITIQQEVFTSNSIKDFVVEDLPKVVDTRGFIYIVQDSVFPNHFKIGRTCDMYKRLLAYNSDKPYPTTNLTHISKEFKDCVLVETKILEHLYSKTSPTTFKKEWFDIVHLGLAMDLIEKAEVHFE